MDRVRQDSVWLAAASLLCWGALSQLALSQDKPATAPAADTANAAKAPAATAAEVASWIADLDVRQYRIREKATRQLLAAGTAALDPLLAAANSDRPEAADRAVWLLQQFGNAKSPDVRRAALERLVKIKDRPQVSGAAGDAL